MANDRQKKRKNAKNHDENDPQRRLPDILFFPAQPTTNLVVISSLNLSSSSCLMTRVLPNHRRSGATRPAVDVCRPKRAKCFGCQNTGKSIRGIRESKTRMEHDIHECSTQGFEAQDSLQGSSARFPFLFIFGALVVIYSWLSIAAINSGGYT